MQNEESTNKNRSSISNATSYEEMAEFWDEHDTVDYWEQTYPVEAIIQLGNDEEVIYYGIDEATSAKIMILAKQKGVSARELVNHWLKEKLQEEIA